MTVNAFTLGNLNGASRPDMGTTLGTRKLTVRCFAMLVKYERTTLGTRKLTVRCFAMLVKNKRKIPRK
ncbi:hypothetical protein Y032_0326g2560 [Ancylostoma ceylanicum]|uniref:Uncharacterized protein n=1 Tax=Ancylostoma ceylanicum TaxID=53326 RepID=A0A016RZX4_9BILA|nr:hypothetical protein Y032_0326g2560 [Ancylostoma ceylanicum]